MTVKPDLKLKNSQQLLFSKKQITGTLIWYFYICHREVWLMAREINAIQDNSLLELGRILSQDSYSREKKEIQIGHIKIDLLKKDGKKLVVGEVKKTSRFVDSAKMQLAFYLYQLKQQGIEAVGELLIPKEKKKIPVFIDKATEKELEASVEKIHQVIGLEKPPEPKKIRFCTKCAYREFCWV